MSYNEGEYMYGTTLESRRRQNYTKTSFRTSTEKDKENKTERSRCCCGCTWLKFFQVVVYLCSFTAFLYFVITYVILYLTYPTVVIVGVSLPEKPDLPALTICNNNLFLKNKICKNNTKFPYVFDALCNGTSNKLTHSKMLKKLLYQESAQTLRNISHQKEDLFKFCKLRSNDSNYRNLTEDKQICRNAIWVHLSGANCYVLNTRWYRDSKKVEEDGDQEFHLLLDLQQDEYFDIHDFGAEIYLHSPSEMPDKRTSSFISKDRKSYSVGFTKTTIKLLEPPYRTKCKNYKSIDRSFLELNSSEGGGSDNFDKRKFEELQHLALGDTLCKVSCWVSLAMRDEFNCVPDCIIFTYVQKKCNNTLEERNRFCDRMNAVKHTCDDKCPNMCNTEFYDIMVIEDVFQMDEEKNQNFNIPVTIDRKGRRYAGYVEITLHLNAVRHISYVHSPRYESVEFLGYIGGYLGIFLGVSLPLLMDYVVTIFKRFFRIFYH